MATKNDKPETRRSVTEEDVKVYDSLEEAQKARPEGKPNWSLWQIGDPQGRLRWTWSNYGNAALAQVCIEHDHYSLIAMDDVPTRNEVGAMLAALPAEDRAALIASYAKKK
jgi:hypothetical protein